MPGLQWCQHCKRIWLDPLWDVGSVSEIPERCVRRGCVIRVRLFHADLLGLRRKLHDWALSEGFEENAAQSLLQQFESAIGFAKRQGKAAAYAIPKRRRVRGLPGDGLEAHRTTARAVTTAMCDEKPDKPAIGDVRRAWDEVRDRLKRENEEDRARRDYQRAQLDAARAEQAESELEAVRKARERFESDLCSKAALRRELGELMATLMETRFAAMC